MPYLAMTSRLQLNERKSHNLELAPRALATNQAATAVYLIKFGHPEAVSIGLRHGSIGLHRGFILSAKSLAL